MNSNDLLRNLKSLNDEYYFDSALDLLYEELDKLLHAGKWDEISDIINQADPYQHGVDACLGLLSVSRLEKDKIDGREKLEEKVRAVLIKLGEDPDEVLSVVM